MLGRDPQLLYEFLMEHNLHRFAGGVAHERPWWYYAPIVAVACLPWAPLLPCLLRHLACRDPQVVVSRSRPLGYLLLCSGWCLVFFTLSRGKLPLYILPSLAPLALALGWYLDQMLWRLQPGSIAGWIRNLLPGATLVGMAAAWGVVGGVLWWRGMVGNVSFTVAGVVGVAGVLAALLLVRRRQSAVLAWAACAAVGLAVDADLAHRLVPAVARARSPLVAAAETVRLRGAALACPGQQWATFAFACRGDVLDIEKASATQLWTFARSHPATFVISAPGHADRLCRDCPPGLASEVVRRGDGWTILLVRQDARAASGR